MTAIDRLFEPAEIGGMALRNRVFVSAHTTNFGRDNAPTARHVAYHRERSRGGVGLIITEGVRVHPTSAAREAALGIFSADGVEPYRALPEAVHAEGARIVAQLLHLGRQAAGDFARTAAWAPTTEPWKAGAHVPHQMTTDDIATIVAAFGSAGGWMLDAGFDGLEIHMGHGHLLQQFLSPAVNRRTDAYGGTDEKRLRFSREVIEAVLEAAAGRGPVGIRISADEFLPGGLVPATMVEIVGQILADYPLAFVHVSHSAYVGAYSLSTQMADMSFPPAPFRSYPAMFKAAFPDVPILAICRLDDVETAADLLAANEADLVGMTRAHIADPHLLAKARAGRVDTVRSCIACNQGCIGRIEQNLPMSCVVNPRVGLEAEWTELERAAAAPADKKVLVVGGGPGGLEAATVAARRGLDVTLAEATDVLGGQVRLGSSLSGRERFGLLVEEQERDAVAAGVRIRTGWQVQPHDILAGDWSSVIIATGATEQPDDVSGIGQAHSVEAALRNPDTLGATVVLVDDDGSWAGAGLAEHLARDGRRVHLVSSGGIAWAITTYSRLGLVRRLGELGVHTHPGRRLTAVVDGSAELADVVSGLTETLPQVVTGVVHAAPRHASTGLAAALREGGFDGEVQVVGDAYAPRSSLEAVFEGRLAATALGLPAEHPALRVRSPEYLSGSTPFHR